MIRFGGERAWDRLTPREQEAVNWHRVEIRGLPPLVECGACPGDGLGDVAGKAKCKRCGGDGAVEDLEAAAMVAAPGDG